LTYLGRHFAAFLAAEGIDTPDLGADPEAGIRPVAVRLAAWLRQQRTRSGRPLAPPTIGLIQTTVAGFTPSWPTGAPKPPGNWASRGGPG
jgi:hypothetical protein